MWRISVCVSGTEAPSDLTSRLSILIQNRIPVSLYLCISAYIIYILYIGKNTGAPLVLLQISCSSSAWQIASSLFVYPSFLSLSLPVAVFVLSLRVSAVVSASNPKTSRPELSLRGCYGYCSSSSSSANLHTPRSFHIACDTVVHRYDGAMHFQGLLLLLLHVRD